MNRLSKHKNTEYIRKIIDKIEREGYVKLEYGRNSIELYVQSDTLKAKMNGEENPIEEAIQAIFSFVLREIEYKMASPAPTTRARYQQYSKKAIEQLDRIIYILSSTDRKYVEELTQYNDPYNILRKKYEKDKNIKNSEEGYSLAGLDAFFKIYDLISALQFEQNLTEKRVIENQIVEFYEKNCSIRELGIPYAILTNKPFDTNPAIACEDEIKQLSIALLTDEKSAMLVGPPGAGKTSIVEGLAYLIQKEKTSKALKDKKIIKISSASLVSGCTLVGMLEAKVEKLMIYLENNPDVILFIDEGHTLIGAGRGQHDTNDVANMLKQYLDRGRIKMITCTTTSEYEKYIKSNPTSNHDNDPAFARRFIKVDVAEKDPKIIKEILARIITKKEKRYNIKWFSDPNLSHEIISIIVDCTKKEHRDFRVSENSNPDLSITILDYAFAHAKHEDRTEIAVEDVIEGIDNATFIYKGVREKYIDKLRKKIKKSQAGGYTRKKELIIFPTPPYAERNT